MIDMFPNIEPNELQLLAKACKGGYTNSDGEYVPERSIDQVYNDLDTISKMLTIRKVKMLLIRKRGFQKALDGIMNHAIEKEKGGSHA